MEDIPEELKSEHGKLERKKNLAEGKKIAEIHDFADGERVEHPTFGEGVVISTKGELITIAFMKVGLKKISARYGKLKKI